MTRAEAAKLRRETHRVRDLEILALRAAGHPLREIAERYGISRDRVQQIEASAKRQRRRAAFSESDDV